MSKIKLVLESARGNLAAMRSGDPSPCLDAAIESAEVVEKLSPSPVTSLSPPALH